MSSAGAPANFGESVSVKGTQTITGDKTFSGVVTMSGGTVTSQATGVLRVHSGNGPDGEGEREGMATGGEREHRRPSARWQVPHRSGGERGIIAAGQRCRGTACEQA